MPRFPFSRTTKNPGLFLQYGSRQRAARIGGVKHAGGEQGDTCPLLAFLYGGHFTRPASVNGATTPRIKKNAAFTSSSATFMRDCSLTSALDARSCPPPHSNGGAGTHTRARPRRGLVAEGVLLLAVYVGRGAAEGEEAQATTSLANTCGRRWAGGAPALAATRARRHGRGSELSGRGRETLRGGAAQAFSV